MIKILQINYRLNSSISDFLAQAGPVADMISNFDGLRWKIWLKNEDQNEGGGLYLFENEAAIESFVNGPIVERLRANPALAELSVKVFDIPSELSSITQAPI